MQTATSRTQTEVTAAVDRCPADSRRDKVYDVPQAAETAIVEPHEAAPQDPAPAPAGAAEGPARSWRLALAAAEVARENRGRDIVVLDLRGVTPVFDYFVIATGASRRQLHAISEEIDHKLEDELGDKRMGIEGYAESRWILLDYGSVVIHLLDEETRGYYALEELWSGAERAPLPWDDAADPPPASGDASSPALGGGDGGAGAPPGS